MAVTQLSWQEALEAVKAVRPVANPNPGFRQQLEEYGRSKSARKVRGSSFVGADCLEFILTWGKQQPAVGSGLSYRSPTAEHCLLFPGMRAELWREGEWAGER